MHNEQLELEPMMPDTVYQVSRGSMMVEIKAQESSRPYFILSSDAHDSMMTDTEDEESIDNIESSDESDSEDGSLPWSFLNKYI